MTSTQLLNVISIVRQHVSTSKGNHQASGTKYIKGNMYNESSGLKIC